MADLPRGITGERDVDQAIVALKKGAYLLKYGRRGKPKFCPFRLAADESILIWYSGKEEKHIKLSHVSKIIPGQRTAIFQRYPRPEKEYQSFSLLYNDRSLDLICKDKDEAEVWFVGLKALISRGTYRKLRAESRGDRASSDSPGTHTRKHSPSVVPFDSEDTKQTPPTYDNLLQNGLGKAFSDVVSYTATAKVYTQSVSGSNSLSSFSSTTADNSTGRGSATDTVRVSSSSALSSSSQGSGHEDFDALGDVILWGEGIGDGVLGGGMHRVGGGAPAKIDALLPKALESAVMLDVHNLACGNRHAVLVTKQGEIFSWGEESGGRLGHGIEADVSHPKLIDNLNGVNIELIACGEYHTCAVTLSGDLYTWGNGTYNTGLLGHGTEVSHWIPKKVCGQLEGLHVSSVSCGPWHTAAVTSAGQLFTFGDGTFGALGHGDRNSTSMPREVESLRGLRTVRVACGVWHTAAVVEVTVGSSSSGSSSSGKLFTWGDGDKGRLGHGDKDTRLVPACVASLVDASFSRVACGSNMTIALTSSGQVYSMGSTAYGQLGNPKADGNLPTCVQGKISNSFVEEIACGSYHVAVLTSKSEVYTWGKGANGRLGHGDNEDRNAPTLVEALKDKQVKSVVCGSNFTAAICLHKWVSTTDNSICSGCRNPFGFRRKRHNCYNCGLVFCNLCSSRKSLKASLAPNINKPYRVCDDCFNKLKKIIESGSTYRFTKNQSGSTHRVSSDTAEKESVDARLLGQLSRLSSVESSKNVGTGYPKRNKRPELNTSRLTHAQIGNSQWGSFYSTKLSTSLFESSKKVFSASVPGSKSTSRASSPVYRRTSPPRSATPKPTVTVRMSPEVDNGDSKYVNNNVNEEVVLLRAQVVELNRKSEILEAELKRTSKQLKEATALAGSETAKCKAAKEVIKDLTTQLKDLAERASRGSTGVEDSMNLVPAEDRLSSRNFLESKSNGHLQTSPLSGPKLHIEPTEWVVQDEPGVYLTLFSLPGGGKDLRRVRFSRRRFSEKQAEAWWAENRTKVHERHDIQNTSRSVNPSFLPPPPPPPPPLPPPDLGKDYNSSDDAN